MTCFSALSGLFCGLFFSALHAQNLSFTRTYGGERYDDVRGLVPARNGDFVFTGLTKSAGDTLGMMYLTRVNAAGAVIWTRYFDRLKEDGGNSLLATRDGGYLITGHTALSYGSECDGYLVKTDADGKEQWRCLVGTAFDDVCNASLELDNGTFLTVGRVEDAATHTFRVMLAKIDARGRQVFLKSLGGDQPCLAYKIGRSADGNFFVAGYALRAGGGDTEMLVMKCTPDGDLLWQTAFGTPLDDRAYGLVALPDGSCFVAGGSAQPQPLAARLSAEGEVTAFEALAVTGWVTDASSMMDGHFALAGAARTSLDEPAVFILNEKLELLGTHRIGNVEGQAKCLLETGNGRFIIGGAVGPTYGASSTADMLLARFSTLSGVQDVDLDDLPSLLFPNPFHDSAYLKAGLPNQPKTLSISTLEGRLLSSLPFDGEEVFVPRGDLQPGLYPWVVRDEKGRVVAKGKLMIE